MGIHFKNAVQEIKTLVKAIQEPLPDREYCEACAAAALKYCVQLYGAPADIQNSYTLVKGLSRSSGCGYALGKYTIYISPLMVTREELCYAIGHEMYHRVTLKRTGLRRQPWIDEMMAFITSRWFLEQQGFPDYAKAVKGHLVKHPGKVNLNVLREFQYSFLHLSLKTIWQEFPENFYEDVARLGIALCYIVSSDDLCRVIVAETLENWIDSLPKETQYFVCRTLELPTGDKTIPNDQQLLGRFFYALYRKGDGEGAVEEFQRIVGLQPENGAAFYYLGRAYLHLSQHEAALEAFARAKSLNFQDKWLPHFSGFAYQGVNDFASAVKCFEEAAHSDPEWASAHYYWGESLYKSGDTDGARTVWEKVLTLGEEKFKTRARKALEDGLTPQSTT